MEWITHWKVCAVAASCGLGALGHAADLDAVQRQLIHSSASLNALALACGRLSQSTTDNARADLREAMVSQGVAPTAYEAAYAHAQQLFWQQWQHSDVAQQRSSCQQMQWQSAWQVHQP